MALLSIALSGCFYPAFQTPETLPPGKISLGMNFAGGPKFSSGSENSGLGEFEFGICAREGITSNLDAGLRLSLPWGVMVDAKYRFLGRPLSAAADLGFSYLPSTDIGFDSPDRVQVFAWYPMVLAGNSHFYGGLKSALVLEHHTDLGNVDFYAMPGLLVGASLGRRFKVLPELNVFYRRGTNFDSHERVVTAGVGIGLQYRL
jgi:hypothetical protein